MSGEDEKLPEFETMVRDFARSFTPCGPKLPLTHITPMFAFRAIINGTTLNPELYETYGRELTYFFYGRPAYRVKQNVSHKLSWSVPILFILDPEKAYTVERVLPFDSGAFHRGLYGNIFAERSKLEHFELDPSIESAQRLVTALYDNNSSYYRGASEKACKVSDFDFELQGIAYLAKQPGQQLPNSNSTLDERASAIEIQVSGPVDISTHTLALVIPETLLTNAIFCKAVKNWGLKSDQIETYTGVIGPGSEAWVGQLYERVKDIYKSKGYL